MNIRHPYNFVPLAPSVEKEEWEGAPSGHERWEDGQCSGTFVCKLKTETLLCIKKAFEELKSRNMKPVIPGSSLRGMVRSLAQALGAGCGYKYLLPENANTPLGDLRPCDSKRACLVCRVFGYSAEGEEFGWAGKVRFSDAILEGTWNVHSWREMPKGGGRWPSPKPRTRHGAFYFSGGDHKKPLGWKVYRHTQNPRAALISEKATFWTGACVGGDTSFTFDVGYENLTPKELAVLRFSLTLDHECPEHDKAETFQGQALAHKLGYGKPAGLGSCTITITDDRPENPLRYFEEQPGRLEPAAKCPLGAYLRSPGFSKLREYLSWSARADYLLYPSRDFDETRAAGWFDRNPKATIADYENTGVSNWQLVRITGVSPRRITCETERNGRTYSGISSPAFDGLAEGGECFVWVAKWDDTAGTFEGITA